MPPEKSPPPHNAAAASASSAFPCNTISIEFRSGPQAAIAGLPGRRNLWRRRFLRRRPVSRLRYHRQIGPRHSHLHRPVLPIDERLMRVIADRVLRPNLGSDLRKARLDAPLPDLPIEVSARLFRIRIEIVIP